MKFLYPGMRGSSSFSEVKISKKTFFIFLLKVRYIDSSLIARTSIIAMQNTDSLLITRN